MAVNVNIPKPTYTKNDIGLGNVDNTSDLNKPISTATQTALDGKVDKVTGKGLSENDFTNTLKTKLDGIEAGAEVNVNADWNATSGDAQILNKPTIPSVTGLVPYTGATGDVDLGANGLDAKFIKIKGTAGNGHLNLKHQSSGATAGGSESVIYADASGNPKWKNDGNAVQNVMLENSAITGATKTKITYDAKGLVTSGTDATTADIADSTDKRYVTDAQLTVLGNTSGTNSGDETESSILSKVSWFPLFCVKGIGNTTTGGTVRYTGFVDGAGVQTTDVNKLAIPIATTYYNFCVLTSTLQPATGSSVFTILKNGANTGVVVTIPAGSGAGTFIDTTNTLSVAQGDIISIKWVNNASSAACTVSSFSMASK